MKSRGGKSQRREKQKKEDQRRERARRKKMQAHERKGRKVAKHSVFPMICSSGRLKSRLAKAAGAEPSGEMRDEMKNCTPLWCETHFEVKMHKTLQGRSTFGS